VLAWLGYAPVTVATLVTAQNSAAFLGAQAVDPALVGAQLDAVLAEGGFACVKVGAIGSAEVAAQIARQIAPLGIPVVVDPVLASSSAGDLTSGAGGDAVARLARLASVVTPNAAEAATLAIQFASLDARRASLPAAAGSALAKAWDATVVVSGVPSGDDAAIDLLCEPGAEPRLLEHPLVPGIGDVRGTGCMFSASLAAYLGDGRAPAAAVRGAQSAVSRLLCHAAAIGTGRMQIDVASLIASPRQDSLG
jgi:hydroxymethylpyrimidine/phosphomethylpyrimidine kinase